MFSFGFKKIYFFYLVNMNKRPWWIRTNDLRFTSPKLQPLSYNDSTNSFDTSVFRGLSLRIVK